MGAEGLPSLLRAVKAFLDDVSATEVIAFFTNDADTGWMNGHVADIDHVGFIGPVGAEVASVAEALTDAGFDLELRSFPSVVVARELGALRGVPLVPTTILLARGASRDGRKVSVEIFLPQEEDAVVREWIERGVASHLALTVSGRDAFRGAKVSLERAKFRVPAFKVVEPLTVIPQSDGRQFLTMYLDRPSAEETSRIELCCYVDRVTPSLYPSSG